MPQRPERHTEHSILQSYLLPPSSLPTFLPYSAFTQLVPAQTRNHPNLKHLYRTLQLQRNIDVDTVRQNIEREVNRGLGLKANLARRVAEESSSSTTTTTTSNSTTSKAKKRKRDDATAATTPNDQQEIAENDNYRDNDDDDDELTNAKTIALDTAYFNASLHPSHTHTGTNMPRPSNTHPLTTTTSRPTTHHTISSLLSAMDTASTSLEDETADLEAEETRLMGEMDEIVGSLSDLRYGKFAKPVGEIGDADGGRSGDPAVITLEDEIVAALRGLEENARRVIGISDYQR